MLEYPLAWSRPPALVRIRSRTLAEFASARTLAEQKLSQAGVRERAKVIETIDGVSLEPFADAAFEAVIALGPYYHLTSEPERSELTALLFRVSRATARVHAAFIPRLSGLPPAR